MKEPPQEPEKLSLYAVVTGMDVKEIRSDKPAVEATSAKLAPSQTSQLDSTASNVDPVSVQVTTRADTAQQNKSRSAVNSIIAIVNVASEAASDINKLVESISGIVEQASETEMPENRRAALEREANQLVNEVKKKVHTEAPGGIRPLAGDKVRVEVEEKVRKTLEVVLPDLAQDNLGLGVIRFSPKEAIIDTKVSIETARKRVDQLSQTLEQAKAYVKLSADELEASVSNNGSAAKALRDIDNAFATADGTQVLISADPEKALKSAGDLKQKALTLLD